MKSDNDPYDESFLLITLVFDFHLIRLDEKYRAKYQTEFGVATSPTAIVIQFEDQNQMNVENLLNNIKE